MLGVAETDQQITCPAFLKQFCSLGVQFHERFAAFPAHHLHVLPAQLGADPGAERFADRLLRGEPRGQKRPGSCVGEAIADFSG